MLAKYSGDAIAPDEIIPDDHKFDYEGKRDTWKSYDTGGWESYDNSRGESYETDWWGLAHCAVPEFYSYTRSTFCQPNTVPEEATFSFPLSLS